MASEAEEAFAVIRDIRSAIDQQSILRSHHNLIGRLMEILDGTDIGAIGGRREPAKPEDSAPMPSAAPPWVKCKECGESGPSPDRVGHMRNCSPVGRWYVEDRRDERNAEEAAPGSNVAGDEAASRNPEVPSLRTEGGDGSDLRGADLHRVGLPVVQARASDHGVGAGPSSSPADIVNRCFSRALEIVARDLDVSTPGLRRITVAMAVAARNMAGQFTSAAPEPKR